MFGKEILVTVSAVGAPALLSFVRSKLGGDALPNEAM